MIISTYTILQKRGKDNLSPTICNDIKYLSHFLGGGERFSRHIQIQDQKPTPNYPPIKKTSVYTLTPIYINVYMYMILLGFLGERKSFPSCILLILSLQLLIIMIVLWGTGPKSTFYVHLSVDYYWTCWKLPVMLKFVSFVSVDYCGQ